MDNIKKYDNYCFIDSSSFLHFKLFTDIDWSKFTHSKSTLLIICPAVMKELDIKKDTGNTINLRHRARKVILKISEILTSNMTGSIKENLDLKFIPNEPSIYWNKEQLDPQISDDRIIASILEQKNNFQNIILVAYDTGLKLKANSKGIRCVSLPEEYRLSEKKDKKQIELEELKNKIAILENRLPILKLKILDDNKPSNFVKNRLIKYNAPSDEEFTERLQVLKSELEYKLPSKNYGGLIGLSQYFNKVSEDEIKRYKKDLDEYIKKMSIYFKKEMAFKEHQSRIIELRFVILNTGNKPAEDIDIFIYFPDGSKLLSDDELSEKPDEPEKPTPPRSLQDTLYGFRNFSIPNLNPIMPRLINTNINSNLPSGPYIKKTNSYDVKFNVPKLKHNIQITLDPVYILFKSIELAKSFSVSYSILADNLPEPSEGTLNIVIYN